MKFTEAFELLKKGHYVTRHAWEDGAYLALLPKIPNVWKINTVAVGAGAHNWSRDDFDAQDWNEVAKEPCSAQEAADVAPAE